MASRLDHFMEIGGSGGSGGASGDNTEEDKIRLKSLSDFQKEALAHACSFPQVTRVVYSTCSIHDEENEHVVLAALKNEEKRRLNGECGPHGPFRLACALPTWPRRGREGTAPKEEEDEEEEEDDDDESTSEGRCWKDGLSKEEASHLIRVDPHEDRTNGFFVALFVRGDHVPPLGNATTIAASSSTTISSIKASSVSSTTAPTSSSTLASSSAVDAEEAERRRKKNALRKEKRKRKKLKERAAAATAGEGRTSTKEGSASKKKRKKTSHT